MWSHILLPTEEILQNSMDGFVSHSPFSLSFKLKLTERRQTR